MYPLKSLLGLFLLLLLSTTGCDWLNQSEQVPIIGVYEVGWYDLVRNRNISKPIKDCSGCTQILVEGYVYAVGNNDRYIIAKQHVGSGKETYFYIIDIQKNEQYGGDKGVHASGWHKASAFLVYC